MQSYPSLKRLRSKRKASLVRAVKMLSKARAKLLADPTEANRKAYAAKHDWYVKRKRAVRAVEHEMAERRHLTRTVAMDGVPMFRGHALMLQDARDHGSTFRCASADRREGVAEHYGHMSQAALYRCFLAKSRTGRCPPECHGNCNPANPPGHSSHELRSDGTSFFARRGYSSGERMPWWLLGLDVYDTGADGLDGPGADDLERDLKRLGYPITRPYFPAPRELHHLNCTASPVTALRRRKIIP